MTDIPRYHAQPATLDPSQELPDQDERPLAQGHDDEASSEVAEAHDKHREAVEAEARAREEAAAKGEPAPGEPQQPGEGAEEPSEQPAEGEPSEPPSEQPAEQPVEQPSEQPNEDDEDVPSGTIDGVLAWVGDDHDRAQRALDAERAGQNRSTLVTQLEAI
jgi:outer membrane biosynthesis protein TonB